MDDVLTVGEVAARSGVPVSTIHFYEAEGLIRSERTSGNQRRFKRGELRRMPVELYWSLAFAPLYQLIQFQRNGFGGVKRGCSQSSEPFVLTDEVIDLALDVVAKGLAPAAGV